MEGVLIHTNMSVLPCALPDVSTMGSPSLLRDGDPVRLFEVMNWSTRRGFILAVDADEACAIALETRLIRRGRPPRRLRDVTEACLEEDTTGTLAPLLAAGEPGTAVQTEEGWSLQE